MLTYSVIVIPPLQLLHIRCCSILWCLSGSHLCHPALQCCHVSSGDQDSHQARTWPFQKENQIYKNYQNAVQYCRSHVPLWSDVALWCTNCHWIWRPQNFHCLSSSLCDPQCLTGLLHLPVLLYIQQGCQRVVVSDDHLWPQQVKVATSLASQICQFRCCQKS